MEERKSSVFVNRIKTRFLLGVCGAVCILFFFGIAYGDSRQMGIVATVASDYSSSALSVATVDPKTGPRIVLNNQLPSAKSDITVKAFGSYFYRLGKYQSDNVTKVAVNAPNTPIWQYSSNDAAGESSNPYDLIFVNSQKAYLLRYGATTAWIVNPSATTEAAFKIGELDLSAYSDDGVPEMAGGVIANGRLFIILQRLDSFFCPSNTAYVAVFDVATDTEIDTGHGQGNMKGIPLSIKNPLSIQYAAGNNTVYIQGVGSFPGGGWCDPVYEYTGGIESINPQTYATRVVLDDGDATSHPYGAIAGMLIASPTKGYFVGYAGWGDNALYQFNPTTGAVTGALEGFQNIIIAGMESGTYLDKNRMMWVCNQSDATVDIVNTENNTLSERLDTNLNPLSVAFCTTGAPLPPELGFTMTGDYVTFHWNTVSGAEGYYLWGLSYTSQYGFNSGVFDWGTNTSATARMPDGMTLYVAIVPFNADGFGEASNVVRAEYTTAQ